MNFINKTNSKTKSDKKIKTTIIPCVSSHNITATKIVSCTAQYSSKNNNRDIARSVASSNCSSIVVVKTLKERG